MISARCAAIHSRDTRIDVEALKVEGRDTGIYELRIRGKEDAICDGLVVYLSQKQCETIRDSLLALFPLEPVADPRDFPGSIAPSLLAGEGGAP